MQILLLLSLAARSMQMSHCNMQIILFQELKTTEIKLACVSFWGTGCQQECTWSDVFF